MHVPDKGWGSAPVKVCETCFQERKTSENSVGVDGEVVVVDTR
jgi:hypothetical protein